MPGFRLATGRVTAPPPRQTPRRAVLLVRARERSRTSKGSPPAGPQPAASAVPPLARERPQAQVKQWWHLDSNQGRRSRRVYSADPLPLGSYHRVGVEAAEAGARGGSRTLNLTVLNRAPLPVGLLVQVRPRVQTWRRQRGAFRLARPGQGLHCCRRRGDGLTARLTWVAGRRRAARSFRATSQDRTGDLALTMGALCQLSYRGVLMLRCAEGVGVEPTPAHAGPSLSRRVRCRSANPPRWGAEDDGIEPPTSLAGRVPFRAGWARQCPDPPCAARRAAVAGGVLRAFVVLPGFEPGTSPLSGVRSNQIELEHRVVRERPEGVEPPTGGSEVRCSVQAELRAQMRCVRRAGVEPAASWSATRRSFR